MTCKCKNGQCKKPSFFLKVAKCAFGRTGLILKKRKDSKTGKTLYVGACLDKDHAGEPWQSAAPRILGTLGEWIKSGDALDVSLTEGE